LQTATPPQTHPLPTQSDATNSPSTLPSKSTRNGAFDASFASPSSAPSQHVDKAPSDLYNYDDIQTKYVAFNRDTPMVISHSSTTYGLIVESLEADVD
jgi:hypothetical protein